MPDKKESDKVSMYRKAYRLTPKGKYQNYKDNASHRNIDFNLSFDEFMTFWKDSCEYCGDSIATVGIDRLDSSKGYFIDNLVSCCFTCNRIKMDLDLDELNNHILKMLKHQGII